MAGIITLVVTLVVSLLVTRVGAVALSLTGMSQDSARFQARSAYTGVGFTTSESEQVVNHPVRRRILMGLMLTGNIGIAVVIASMMSTFATVEEGDQTWWIRLSVLTASLLALWVIGTRQFIDQAIERIIRWALTTWTTLDVRDYVSLLHLSDGYVVFEMKVNEGDWIASKSLSQAKLSSEGVLVLGVHRANGSYAGSPNGSSIINVGDVLSVYGPADRLEELDIRKMGWEGDQAHKKAIEEQQLVDKKTQLEDEAAEIKAKMTPENDSISGEEE